MDKYFSSPDELAPIGHALAFFRNHCEYEEEQVQEFPEDTIVCFFDVKVVNDFLSFKAGMQFADVQYLSKRKIFHINVDDREKNFTAMQVFWDGGKIDATFKKEMAAQVWCSARKFDCSEPHYNYKIEYVPMRRDIVV